jgi:hypothetical protein
MGLSEIGLALDVLEELRSGLKPLPAVNGGA